MRPFRGESIQAVQFPVRHRLGAVGRLDGGESFKAAMDLCGGFSTAQQRAMSFFRGVVETGQNFSSRRVRSLISSYSSYLN